MTKAILMSIPLIAMVAGAADATVIYNWRPVDFVQNDEIITGQIRFSYKAWLARRAEVDFEAVLVPYPGSGTPENPPRFLYTYGQDVVGLSFGIRGIAFPPIDLVQGWNRAYLDSSGFGLYADIAFTKDRQLFGSIGASYRSVASAGFIGGNPIDWRATARSDGACSITCVTTGFWELDPRTDPRRVPEPGGFLLVLAGLLGVGLLTSRQPRCRRRQGDRKIDANVEPACRPSVTQLSPPPRRRHPWPVAGSPIPGPRATACRAPALGQLAGDSCRVRLSGLYQLSGQKHKMWGFLDALDVQVIVFCPES